MQRKVPMVDALLKKWEGRLQEKKDSKLRKQNKLLQLHSRHRGCHNQLREISLETDIFFLKEEESTLGEIIGDLRKLKSATDCAKGDADEIRD